MKRIISVLLAACMITVLFSGCNSNSSGLRKEQMYKGLLLYVGYWGYSNGKYPEPTDEQLKQILEVTDEFVLVPTAVYNCYTDKLTGEEKQILNNDIIDSMTTEWIGRPSSLESLKVTYKNIASSSILAGYNISDYVEDATKLGNRLVELDPDVKLWYSVPGAAQLTALTYLFADSWVQVVDEVKEALEPEVWENNVYGFYYSDEDVVTGEYAKFDEDKPEENFNNPDVYAMRQVSDKVHSYDKSFLWIPYSSDTNGRTYENLGYVANKTDIFDMILIQPSYFFDASLKNNPQIIKNCVEKQAVVREDGEIIGETKTSDTVIGWEMEIDATDIKKGSAAETRYQAYVDAFKDLRGVYPTAYYASIITETVDVLDKISEFYSFDKAGEKSSAASASGSQIIVPVAIAGGAVILIAVSVTAVLLIKKRK